MCSSRRMSAVGRFETPLAGRPGPHLGKNPTLEHAALRLASAAASWAAKDGSVNDHAGHRSFSSKAFLDTAPGFSRAGYISARIQIATDRTGPIF